MKGLSLLALLGLGCLTQAGGHPSNDYENNDYYVLRLNSGIQPRDVARRLGLEYDGQLASLEDHHVFLKKKHEGDLVEGALEARRSLRKRGIDEADVLDSVRFAQKQVARKRLVKRGLMPPHGVGIEARSPKRYVGKINAEAEHRQTQLMQDLHITDPIFPAQWHLFNTIELGHDINVTDVWRQGITGHNVSVCIVDDGLDQTAGDLKDNYFAAGSWDFNGGPKGEPPGPDPIPRLFDDKHGTRCAGEVAAGKNDFCGLGVAYNAKIAGVRILSAPISDKDEAAAMIYALDKNHIYSCSWGPPDDGKSMDAPGILIKSAMLQGIQKGREGKGAIYIFASGNGANFFDNCNFDGYTNSIYSLTIGAVDRKGIHPFYAEKCSAQLVVTYSSGSGDAIHTTDKGSNTCTDIHGGTSAAAPLAAGIVALMLEARPDLTWRDVQAILMETAIRIDSADDWETTAVGRKFSHTFGYGKIDTYSAVEHAKKFKLLKPQSWYFSPWVHVKQPVPQGTVGIVSHLDVSKEMLVKANLDHVEHVTVTMNVNHTRRGDLSVNLISPAGVVSHLAEPRELDDAYEGYVDWTFMSVAHWGESGVGTWSIVVYDTKENSDTGTFWDWRLKLWGESIDASKATLLPMPTVNDDNDHDIVVPVTTAEVGTTTVKPVTPPTPSSNPSDAPTRPVKPTPAQADASSSTSPTNSPTSTAQPSSWVPGWLPSFGFGAKTVAWTYGAVVLIVAFCAGLGVYFYIAKRKRRAANARDSYEFDLIPDQEEARLMGGGAKGGKGGKRRAGELYDAFAAGSEDEDEFFHESDDDDVMVGGSGSGSGSGERSPFYRDKAGSAEEVAPRPERQRLELRDEEHHVLGDDSGSDGEEESHDEKR